MKLIPDGLKSFFQWSSKSTQSTEDLTPKNESMGMINSIHNNMYPSNNISVKHPNIPGLSSNFSGLYVGSMSDEEYKTHCEMLLKSSLADEVQSKRGLMERLETIRDYDYIESTLRDLGTDVLTKNYNESQGPFIQIRLTDEKEFKLEEKLNKDIIDLKIYETLHDIIEDYLFNGQYVLKVDYENNELDDCLDQKEVLPAYTKTKMTKVFDNSTSELHHARNYLVLNLFSSPKKLKIKTEKGSFYTLKLPRGVISESIISKINSLKLLESLQPLIEMQAIDEKMYFYVNFPPGKDAAEAYAEARDYEKLLKSLLTTNPTTNLYEVIDRLSTVKVIPLFGQQGEIRPQTVNKINRIDLDQIEDLRTSISKSMKVNIAGDNESNKEYFKLIKRIRSMIQKSVAEFMIEYIKKKYGKDYTFDDFKIYIPEVKGVDELDTVDYITLAASASKEVISMINEMSEAFKSLSEASNVDTEYLVEYFNDKLVPITGKPIFFTKEELENSSKNKLTPEPKEEPTEDDKKVEPQSD